MTIEGVTSTGLVTKALPEITADLQAGILSIFPGANVNSNSPDGQFIGINAQAGIDLRELLIQIFNSYNPDRASGSTLDERVVINNIARQGGTFTIQPVDVTVSQTVTLQGLDAAGSDINGTGYTVQDDAGNQFILLDTATITAGVHTLDFRAQLLGNVQTVVGTITNPVTIVLGVTSINNSVAATSTGQDEETDAELRVRRANSVALASDGYLNGLLGAVLALPGVNDAELYENVSDTANTYGQPAHSMWLIVDGGANTDIGNIIYNKISYGANMYGAVSVPITTPSGQTFTALFDRPIAAPIYIRFNIRKTPNSTGFFDSAGIKTYLQQNLNFGVNDYADAYDVSVVAEAAIAATSGNGVPSSLQISSDGTTYTDYLVPPTPQYEWVVDTSRISITVLA